MPSVALRIPLGLGKQLHDLVFAPADHEPVAFCLVSHFAGRDGPTLIVRRMIALEDADYIADPRVGARWRGSAMLPVLRAAMDEQLGILLVHAHPLRDPAGLSGEDRASALRLVPMFRQRVPECPHGSIVLGPRSASGLIAVPGASMVETEVHVRWMGSSIVRWPQQPTGDGSLLIGEQSRVRTARVAVVGLSGGGSHVVQQLAHAGVAEVYGVDADYAERKHRHRIIGLAEEHIEAEDRKTLVMQELVDRVPTDTKFVPVEKMVPSAETIDVCREADVIVGCVDNLHARADLQEIAWRYSVPYVDVGANLRALQRPSAEPQIAVGGNVLVLVPGGFCMWCCGFLTREKLELELVGGRERSYFQNRKGEAQVVSFNGTVASAAVTEVLQLLTGFRGESIDPKALATADGLQNGFLKFDGRTLVEWGAERRATCDRCREHLGAGQLVWTRAA